jgi:two-component system OmpR family response regulator
MRILLVEDERDLASALTRALADEGISCTTARDGDEGLYHAREYDYDAIVLDLMLPGQSGWDVLRALRAEGRTVPVLILTALDALDDRVRGLNLGADDYLTKPFAVVELVARLGAIVRRAAGRPEAVLIVGDVHLDLAARRVYRGGEELPVTGREYAILEMLARRRGEVVSRTDLCGHLYRDDDEITSNTIDVHVAALRRKLGAELIQTRRGLGYLIDA